MEIDDFMRVAQVALETAVMVTSPVLVLGLAVGLGVSIFQAATQINDAALAFIPKLGAFVFALIFFGHFMMNRIAGFTTWVFTMIGTINP
jgi:flagellar biosynthetic protein FliQ